MPVLDGIPTSYSHEFHAELVYDLCAALVREGIGTPKTWQACGENALAFAQHAILHGIGKDRCNLLQRNVEYHLQVSDVTERDGYDTALENGQLAVTIECSGAGYLQIGQAIDALEEEAEGLGAAFYWTLTYALYRVIRIYNHDDALQYEERMKEYAEEDPENKNQYEFPDVEKALPECIRNTLAHDHKGWILRARRLLSKSRGGRYGSWIERLRKIQQLSRLPLHQSRDFLENGNYDSPPLPCLLVAFKEHDAVTACFDEEGQYMLEGSSEPALGVVFCPQRPDEVRHALRIVGRFIALNHELFQLVEALQQEKSHAGTDLNRREPSLRAA
ncbi:MAG TPA: hypothetical protein VGB94_08180 [Acidobacteriaceae bacterium]